MSEFKKKGPHLAARVYERFYRGDIATMAPGLRKLQEHQWVIVLLIIVGGVFAGIGGGLFFDRVAYPPVQVWGVCQYSQGQHLLHDKQGNAIGCVTYTIISITANNGAVTYKNQSIPAGSFYYYNGTKFR